MRCVTIILQGLVAKRIIKNVGAICACWVAPALFFKVKWCQIAQERIMTLDQFTGFTRSDFDIFLIPEFHERMSALRTQVRPKLAILGDALAPRLTELLGHAMFAHTASHARRRVNPPDDTWVAFSRSERGYKRYAHFELGIALDYVFVRFVVKPEGEDDKPQLIDYLEREGSDVFALKDNSRIFWYRDDHGREPTPVNTIAHGFMERILQQTRLKSRGFTTGVVFDRDQVIADGHGLLDKGYDAVVQLAPLYYGSVGAHADLQR